MRCDICNKEIVGYEHNAWPMGDGKCCTECDDKYVVPLRIFLTGIMNDRILILDAVKNEISFEKISDELTLKKAQNIVEGYIELYPVKDDNFYFIVNEEGIIKKLKENKLAYQIFGLEVLGNMIVCPKGLFK